MEFFWSHDHTVSHIRVVWFVINSSSIKPKHQIGLRKALILQSWTVPGIVTLKKQSEKYVINCYQVINILHVCCVPFILFVRTLCTFYTFWGTNCTFQSERTVLNDRTHICVFGLKVVHLLYIVRSFVNITWPQLFITWPRL